MPWGDLSEVTGALTRLLETNIEQVLNPGLNVTVVGTPPDQLGSSVTNTISLYLYHVRETAYTQNRPGPGSDIPNIATAPMGLDLFYVLTAHQRTNTGFDAAIEQRLMGYAVKTLHDYPVITDATSIANLPIFTGAQLGRSNRLNVELRKMEPEQSFAIWTTGERQFARLAAYYQVGLVLLEPEPPRRLPGIVLSVGALATPKGGVSLTSSHSDLVFDLPALAGGGQQTLRADPARPSLVAPPTTPSTFTLRGEGLGTGIRQRLILRNTRWAQLSPPADRVPLDPALNAANGWAVDLRPDRIEVQLGTSVTFNPPDAPQRTIDVFPGSYTAQIETILAERVVAGQLRTTASLSNEIGFGIAPRIRTHQLLASDRIRIDLEPAFALNIGPPVAPELDVQVMIDGEVYRRRGVAQPAAGEFRVDPGSLLIGALFPLATPGLHPVRISVEGVDAQPYWISTP